MHFDLLTMSLGSASVEKLMLCIRDTEWDDAVTRYPCYSISLRI
jgi:hypothetical protein